MQAIILAAGRGTRLAEFNSDERPKCLLQFGGESLMSRHMRILKELGVYRAHVVVGYHSEWIRDHVEQLEQRPEISWYHNQRYDEGSVISLLRALEQIEPLDEVLLMDADVLYSKRLLERLLTTEHPNCVLIDHDFEAGDEPVKVCEKDGVIVEFRKKIDTDLDYDSIGESVGFFRLNADAVADLLEITCAYDVQDRGEEPHEEALRDLMLSGEHNFGVEDISGLPWIEIDFPEDINRASHEIMPEIGSHA